MKKLIRKGTFIAALPIISVRNEAMKEFIKTSINSFLDEMDSYIYENEEKGFWHYQIERTLLSMYLSGIVRNDSKRSVTLLQEFAVWNKSNKFKGRCDAFINFKGNVILLEAKRDSESTRVKEDHWDINKWIKWDNKVAGIQLKRYYEAQKKFIGTDYLSCHLMSIVFDNIIANPQEHIRAMNHNLGSKIKDEYSKDWFCTVLFEKDSEKKKNRIRKGLEIYGTIKTIYS